MFEIVSQTSFVNAFFLTKIESIKSNLELVFWPYSVLQYFCWNKIADLLDVQDVMTILKSSN